MAMNVGGPPSDGPTMMATINTTPLVDVMLVLLIIFLITIPVITRERKVELPKAVNIPTVTKPENITISVDSTPICAPKLPPPKLMAAGPVQEPA